MGRLPVAVVHDYLTQRGGAERVVLSMLRAFPDAPLYTALYEPHATFPEFAQHDVRPLWTNRMAALRRDHRRGLLLYPMVFSGLKVDADAVLCSSSGFAHGARATGRKVVYCHSPARWLYDQADTYLASWPRAVRAAIGAAAPALRRWDKRSAASCDRYLANSSAVRQRVAHAYGFDAEVVPPPVPDLVEQERAVDGVSPGYVLCVSRLLGYKNVDAVVQALGSLPEAQLVVVGEGPELARLRSLARPNVTFTGTVTDAELHWLYAHCAGLVSASYEDFGLTAVEAATQGKPVAVLRFGGFLDTVIEGETGCFFDAPSGPAIAEAIRVLLTNPWDGALIRRRAEYFSESAFASRLHDAMWGDRIEKRQQDVIR